MPLDLPDKKRPLPSARALDQWVRDAAKLTGERDRRVGWMLASTIVVAALQRAVGKDGVPLLLAKGGVYLELHLGLGARATQDIDTLFRGSVEQFERTLTDTLSEPWGPFTLQATDIEVIAGAQRVVKPRRFEIKLILKGATWRRVKVEVSFPEGRIGDRAQPLPTPPVGFFGVEAPEQLVGIAMDYQVAQKVHACTDPDTNDFTNDRVRDVVDLLLIKDHFYSDGPSGDLKAACVDVFDARAVEATSLGLPARHWPPQLGTPNTDWVRNYPGLAESVGIPLTLDEAVAAINAWIAEIDAASR